MSLDAAQSEMRQALGCFDLLALFGGCPSPKNVELNTKDDSESQMNRVTFVDRPGLIGSHQDPINKAPRPGELRSDSIDSTALKSMTVDSV
jgi:hypothetical protein